MSQNKKRGRGDRRDGTLIKRVDPMHAFMPYLLLGRADNEAVMNDDVDITETIKYLEKKNSSNPEFKYTLFHVIIAALAKTISIRPAMNRFLQGHRLYQRNNISFSFIVKRAFSDTAEEALVIMKVDPESSVPPLEQVYEKIKKEVYKVRKENKTDDTTDFLAILGKLPRPILRLVSKLLFWFDYHGWLPNDLERMDPYHSTCFISNLGSIKMTATYHHLVDWGTNSIFLIIGEKKWQPKFQKDGSYEMREVLPLGFTIDERIADGYYFANSIKVLRYILSHPQILDEPLNNPIDYLE